MHRVMVSSGRTPAELQHEIPTKVCGCPFQIGHAFGSMFRQGAKTVRISTKDIEKSIKTISKYNQICTIRIKHGRRHVDSE